MAQNEQILRKFQAGIESTRGTAVAATRIVYADINGTYDRPTANFQDRSGTYEARRRHALGRASVAFTATDLLTYEDAPWWFELGIRGGVAAVGDEDVTTEAFTRDYTPSLATDDLKSITLEHGYVGNVYESAQVMVNSMTLRGDPDSTDEPAWMLEADMVGLNWVTSSYTAALTDRETEPILAPGTLIYVDDPGDTIGTTQWTDHLISWSLTINNNLHLKAFAEHVESMAPNKVGRGARTFDGQFTFEFDSDAEFQEFREGTQRLIRMRQTGSEINTGADSQLTVDMYGYWSTISWGDREGNITATMGLMGFFDSGAAQTFGIEVINDQETIV